MAGRIRTAFTGFLVGAVFGAAGGVALGFFLFPYVFAPPPAADELTRADRAAILARGEFVHANPSDPVHWGRGGVSLHETAVFLEPDFAVGPGPAYHVYLVPASGIRRSGDMDGQMFVDLGRLRAFEGSQRYPLPVGLDLADFESIVIWCQHFNVLISPADLQRS